MRIVWASRFGIDDRQEAGASIEQRLLQAVARENEVHVVSAALPPGERTWDVGDVRVRAEGANWWPRYPGSLFTWALRAAWPGPPMEVRATRGRSRSLGTAVRRHLELRGADLVVVAAAELLPVLDACSVPAVLCLQGDLAGEYRSKAGDPKLAWLKRLRWKVDARRAARWERRWARHAVAVGCTDPDTFAELGRLLECEVVLLPLNDAASLSRWFSDALPARPRGDDLAASEGGASSSHRDGERQRATIVLCTRERPDVLEASLPSVAQAAANAQGTQMLIVEQGEPRAREICNRLGIPATVLHDDGTGAARARNLGAAKAAGEIVLFTDDDCHVPPEWVVDHVAAIKNGGVVATCGVVRGISPLGDEGEDPVAWPAYHHAGSPPWAIGHSSNMAVWRDVLLAAGGFDERFGPGAPGSFICEDADLIVRLLRSGGAIRAGVGTPVQHVEWRSAGENYRNLRAYERGSGAWIGKLLREDRDAAVPYLRERIELLRNRLGDQISVRTHPMLALLTVVDFVRGLAFGLRLSAWNGSPSRT